MRLVQDRLGIVGRLVPVDYLRTALRHLLMIGIVAVVAASLPYNAHAAEKSFTLTAQSKKVSVGEGMTYKAWTYDGTVPGPVLRVRQGDLVHVKLINHTPDAHGLDIHAAQIAPWHFLSGPGKPVSYSFRADVPGVFAYHCDANPVLEHIALGMYGMMIVAPKHGWPNGKAQNVVLIQGELYGLPNKNGVLQTKESKIISADPDFVVYNGKVNNFTPNDPIKIKVGELVRVFFLNAGPNLTSAFHVDGALFSTIYVGGNPHDAMHWLNTWDVPPSDGAVFEFRVTQPGNYTFTDLNRGHQYKGAQGVFRAVK